MANIAASTKLGRGFGPGGQDSFKFVCVAFATAATGDVLIFDTSNVGQENALSKIVRAVLSCATGVCGSTLVIASNQITTPDNAYAATQYVAFAIGIGA